MSGYAFSSQEIAQFLKDYANANLSGLGGTQAPLGREVMFVKTPQGGIDKYDGSVFSQEDCDRVYFGEMDYQEDASCKIPVVNVEETDIEGEKIIKAVRVGSSWIALTSSEGGGESTSTYLIVANSGISASVWPTSGVGTGDIWELSSNGAGWVSIGGSSVDVRNPWEETIESGSRMICYKAQDYYVVIQDSCTSE